MARIKELSELLINQVAAGEVIERPSSVVKELVENSIDAGATRISIEISNECRNIRVADNGSGIHPDDIYLAFTKHATSKIETTDDLYNISTLGFRGEALASIISIAKVTCTTRTKDYDYGTKVECENAQAHQSKTSCAIGTIMEVKDLFYNIPARLKFLKNSSTEFSYIQELVQNLALSHFGVAFELKNNGKTVLKTSGRNLPQVTIKEVYGDSVAKNLKEVFKEDAQANLKITGFISTPDVTRASKKYYHISINSRTVKCPVFIKAVDMAYKNLISGGKYPIVILNLEINPNDVDVNIHPTKREVRYKNPNMIFNFIMTAILSGLSKFSGVPNNVADIRAENPKRYENKDFKEAETSNVVNIMFPQDFPKPDKRTDTVELSGKQIENLAHYTQSLFGNDNQPKLNNEEIEKDEDVIIGQYKNTYILIERPDGLEIVDQHIAEERYNYEKLKKEKSVVSQMLFVSDVIPVTHSEAELLKENLSKFERFGYGIEFVSDNEIMFRKIPQMLINKDTKEILAEIFENIEGDIDNLEERILKTTACKASVKAGQKLSTWQMQEIIKK
ncbi:DNA mismatch repair endonuclease MutL, partial [bacterium]|nr:DNA mismatch repair endonuclease MutL [bacterium]